jgi:ornithine cyclodeaminase
VIDADALRRLLPMGAAIDALEAAFGSGSLPEAPPRAHVETASGTLLLMPAHGPQGVGVKLVTVSPDNPALGLPFVQATYTLFDAASQAPVAALDGTALTALRTAAVSGLATRYLARSDARRLVVYGAGVQARSHLEAMRATRTSGLRASVGEPGAEGDADLVCTCTTSTIPVVTGARLAAGAHVNAVGAYNTAMRELDAEAVVRARVVVETREAAAAEAGDLALAMAEGAIGPDHVVADLAEVVAGAVVRTSDEDVTVFKSVGVAFEDLVVARAAVDRLGG